MDRSAKIDRKTKETDIEIELNIDGKGLAEIETGIPFFDHMLSLMAAHGFIDIRLSAKGDTEVDYHHTVEDLGICLGTAISKALGDKKGIRRYGQATVPMDESLASVVIDISNRPLLAYRVSIRESKTGNFDVRLLKEFFRALVNYSGITMHVDLLSGKDPHHVAESIFKAFGRALDMATRIEERLEGNIPSTKGIL
jgi:imidazoleglycerol-phosphate dehydratase